MLKKLSIALCISSLFGVGVAQADAGSASGNIIFTGKVTHEAPTVVVKRGSSGSGDGLTTNPEIQLGEYTAAKLDKNTVFNQEDSRKFQIVIQRPTGTQYNHIQTVDVVLSGKIQNGILLNDLETEQVSGAASNVGVALQYYGTAGYTDNGTAVFNGTDANAEASYEQPNGGFAYDQFDPTFYFAAALQQIDINENIGGGNVKSTLTVNVTYE